MTEHQGTLFDIGHPDQPARSFDGATFDEELDGDRLTGQLARVWTFMLDGQWHTLAELSEACAGTETAVSARLRDLRKNRFGSHTVERRRVADGGLWEYRLLTKRSETKVQA